MRLPLPALCLLLLAFALPAFADPAPLPHPSNLRPDILYTHRGEFVQVSPMRPLTLNVHVEQFAYDPLGLEIAYVGSEPQGENTLHFVKTVDARTGHEISRFAFTAPSDSQQTALMLRGWSTSGKYLMLQRFSPDLNEPQTAVSEFLRWDLSADPSVTHVIDPEAALPPDEQSADLEGSADCYPSPDGRWLVFTQSYHTQKDNGKPGPDRNAYLLYDTEHDTFKLLSLPPKVELLPSWADATNLKIWQDGKRKQFDVVMGQISPRLEDTTDLPVASSRYPDLSLDTEARSIDDLKNTGAQAPAYIVWIRRTPLGKMPLGAAAAGLVPEGAAADNGGFEAQSFPQFDAQSFPQAVWSPTGKQVAFAANGELYVTDLVSAPKAIPNEKMAVGLKPSCEDEQALALSNLKQIGLGIIQYTQDFDEKYPAAAGFEDTIYPYIKLRSVFQVDSHRFVYEKPGDTMASVDSPATTENGYLDLPCARVVLFCDGHVKAYPKQEAAP